MWRPYCHIAILQVFYNDVETGGGHTAILPYCMFLIMMLKRWRHQRGEAFGESFGLGFPSTASSQGIKVLVHQ